MTSLERAAWMADLHWEQRPAHISHRDVAGVAVDASDQVYLFTRFDHQVLVYTSAGKFVRAWGAGIFTNAHSIRIGPDGAVYCVDNGDHSVRKFTPDGELLLTLGVPGTGSDTGYRADLPVRIHNVETVVRPAGPFNGCTDIAIGPGGDIFVSDGYGNCRIHHFSASGTLLNSWGEVGSGPGEFRVPHGICLLPDGRLLVADRENDRIQAFRTDGSYLGEWDDIQRPSGLAFTSRGEVVVAHLWRPADNRSFVSDTIGTDQPGRISLLSLSGELLDQWGASVDDKAAEGNVIAPHFVAVDSRDSIYVGEVTYTYGVKLGRVPADHASHQIQKFTAPRTEG
jgi:DNA-binding beta-propeller fold protein YncE